MSFLKKNILSVVLVLVVYSWFFATNIVPKPSSLQVTGANTNVKLFQQPSAGRAPILDAIKNAKQEILAEVYLLSDKQIIESLINAKQKGVDVKIMLEEHPFGGGNLNNKTKKTLEEKGILVKWANSSFPLTHEKTIVVDKNEVFILNQNLTQSSFTKNREYNVIDTIPEDVREVRGIFISDWERKSITLSKTYLIISPNNSRPALTTLIKESAKTIEIETEIIEDTQIVDLLTEKAKNVQVKIIIPSFSQIQSNKTAVEKLSKKGVLVKTLSTPYVHAKLILIDDKKAYVGSINLSSQSMDENREVGIMLSQNESINLLNSTFQLDWNKAKSIN